MPITLKVRDVMDTNVFSLDGGAKVSEAIGVMNKNNVWSVIVERNGLPVGVVTDRDVIRRCIANGLSPDRTSVEAIESSPLVTIGPDATMREAMDLMASKDIRRIFVVSDGKIVGRITQTELFDSMLSVMETLSSLSNRL
jgi:CBS domain-containing protein